MAFPGLWQMYSWLLQLQPGLGFKESTAGGESTEQVRNSMSSNITAAVWQELVLELNEGEDLLLLLSPADEILRENLCDSLLSLNVFSISETSVSVWRGFLMAQVCGGSRSMELCCKTFGSCNISLR